MPYNTIEVVKMTEDNIACIRTVDALFDDLRKLSLSFESRYKSLHQLRGRHSEYKATKKDSLALNKILRKNGVL